MFNRVFVFAVIFGCTVCAEAQDVYSTGVQLINTDVGIGLHNVNIWGYLGPNFSGGGG